MFVVCSTGYRDQPEGILGTQYRVRDRDFMIGMARNRMRRARSGSVDHLAHFIDVQSRVVLLFFGRKPHAFVEHRSRSSFMARPERFELLAPKFVALCQPNWTPGYVPLSQTGAELLFEIFSQRHERGSTIVTSNLPFEEWTSVFGNQRLTGALLDRLTHHVHILELNGESYRLKQSKARRRRDPRPPDEVAAAADPETGEIIRAS